MVETRHCPRATIHHVVHSGQSQAFRPLLYHSRHRRLPVETFTLKELVGRFGAVYLEANERVSFHVVVLCLGGGGSHHVDFTEVSLRPRRVLHVRPTQVQRWDFSRPYDARLLLFPDSPGLPGGPRWPVGPSFVDLPEWPWMDAMQTIALIEEEQENFTGGPEAVEMLESLRRLVVLQLRLGRTTEQHAAMVPRPYLEFRDAIQADLGRSHKVADYASRLGYSARTLSRACHEARGETAKQVLDEWIGLEARRLLAGSEQPIASIARALGFDEPSNFVKFFRRVAGDTPSTFRRSHQTSD